MTPRNASEPGPPKAPPSFYERLLRVRSEHQQRAFLRGAYLTLALGLLGLVLLAWAAAFSPLAPGGVALLLFLGLLAWLVLLVGWVVLPLLIRPRLHSIVRQLECRRPELMNRLSTALYLKEHTEEAREYGYSPVLMEAVRRSADALAAVETELARDNGPARKSRLVVAGCLLLGGLAFLVTPAGRDGLGRLQRAFVGGETTSLIAEPLQVHVPGDVYVPRGESYEFYASLAGRLGAVPRLHVRPADGEWQALALREIDAAAGRYFHRFERVDRAMDYIVTIGPHASSAARIAPVDRPRITAWRTVTTPPEYTALPAAASEPESPRIDALLGSTVDFVGRCSQPLARAALHQGDAILPVEVVDGINVRGRLVLDAAVPLRLEIEDIYGQKADTEIALHVAPDRPPVVVITQPGLSSDVPELRQAIVRADAADDYGLGAADLVYRLGYEQSAEVRLPVFGPGAAANGTAGAATREAHIVYLFDLSGADLLPGDEVSYWLEVSDTDTIAGPKIGRSAVHRLTVPGLGDQYVRMFGEQSDAIDTMRDVLDGQQRIGDQVRRLREQMQDRAAAGDRGAGDWTLKSHVEQIQQAQEGLSEELSKVSEDVAQQARELADQLDLSYRTIEKFERINALLNELLTEEMRQVLAQFQELVAEVEQRLDDRAVADLELRLEDFEKQLDRTLSLLESSFLERQLEALQHRVEELADMQRALEDETVKAAEREDAAAAAETLAKRQEALQQETERALESLRDLAEQSAENRPEVAERLKEAMEQAEQGDLAGAMEKARDLLGEQEFQEAADRQQSAGEMLAALSGEMKQCSQMAGGQQMDVEALLALCQRGIALADEESRFMKVVAELDRQFDSFLQEQRNEVARQSDQLRIEQRRLLADFEAFAFQSPLVDYQVAAMLEESLEAKRLAIARSRDGTVRGVRLAAQHAHAMHNKAVAQLIESFKMAASAGGAGGMQDYFRRMEQLIRGQRELNQQTERLSQQQAAQNLMEQMLQSALEQRALRQRLSEIQQQFQQFSNQLGDLGGIQEDMAEVEEMARGGADLERIQEKQEQILQKLLDAGRSMEQEDQEKERVAEAADPGYFRPQPDDRALDALEFDEQILRSAEGMSDVPVPPEYRDRVIDYFRSLARDYVQ